MPISAADLETTIRNKIPVSHLEVHDQSSGCGENYAVVIVSEAFKGKTTLARHRYGMVNLTNVDDDVTVTLFALTLIVNEILKAQIAQLHAFSQKTYTPEQYADLVKST